jgi:serine/threonine-protein kinase
MFQTYPQHFGPYLLLEKVGQGGMAEIFRAQTSGPNNFTKEVAIKRILSHLSSNEDFVTQFLDEARIAGSLNHPNIVQIYDVAQVDANYYIAMEYIHGRHLGQVIRRVTERNTFFPVPVAACIINDVAKALSFAHSARDSMGQPLQIIHRDISPQNILLSYHGAVKLTDFGIAKASNKLYQTTAGVIKGKFSYLAPEQLMGAPSSTTSDIFALGVTFWEMLCNRRLFQGKSDIETIQLVQACKIPSVREFRSDIDDELDRIVQTMIHRDHQYRYHQAHQVVHDLSHYLASRAISEDMSVIGQFMVSLFPESLPPALQNATEVAIEAISEAQIQAYQTGQRAAPAIASLEESTRMLESSKLSDFGEAASAHPSARSPMYSAPTAALSPFVPESPSSGALETVDDSALRPLSSSPSPSFAPAPSIASAATLAVPIEAASLLLPPNKGASLPQGLPPNTQKNRSWLGIIALLLLVATGGSIGVFFWMNERADAQSKLLEAPNDPAELRLRISPPDARLMLNGKPIEKTGKERILSLVSGISYHLTVSHDGYLTEKRLVKAREGEISLVINLKPQK